LVAKTNNTGCMDKDMGLVAFYYFRASARLLFFLREVCQTHGVDFVILRFQVISLQRRMTCCLFWGPFHQHVSVTRKLTFLQNASGFIFSYKLESALCIPWIKEQDETCRRALIVANQVTAKALKFCKLNFDSHVLYLSFGEPWIQLRSSEEIQCFNHQRDDLLTLAVVNSTTVYEINCQV
jgi:hypothetical protein